MAATARSGRNSRSGRHAGEHVIIVGMDELGLDAEAIAADLETHRYADRVRADFLGGMRSGVNGTPMFFVNGVRHDGGYGLADLLAVADAAAR